MGTSTASVFSAFEPSMETGESEIEPRVSAPYAIDSWHTSAQHAGYVSLGILCMLINASAIRKFFKEVKTHQHVGQRPLLLAGLVADFMNGFVFTTAGGAGLSHGWTRLGNATVYNETTVWASCMRTLYTPSLLFLHVFMALVTVCTSIDRLTAVITPVFYSQCVKARHCYMLLTLVLFASSGALVAGYSATTEPGLSSATITTWAALDQWPASTCIAPLANIRFARYYYAGLCSLLTISVALDLLSLLSYKKMSLQRITYETYPRDLSVTVRNYLPRFAFSPNDPSRPGNTNNQNRSNQPQSRPAFENTTSGGCSIPLAMVSTTLSVCTFFLIPSMFMWFESGSPSVEDARDQYGTGRRMAAYVAWGFVIYSVINSIIFFMVRKDLRKGIRSCLAHIRAYCRCLCMSLDPTAVCETTPVEVIADPVGSSASTASTLSSLANHPRMKKQRPSIVPLAYGTTEM